MNPAEKYEEQKKAFSGEDTSEERAKFQPECLKTCLKYYLTSKYKQLMSPHYHFVRIFIINLFFTISRATQSSINNLANSLSTYFGTLAKFDEEISKADLGYIDGEIAK